MKRTTKYIIAAVIFIVIMSWSVAGYNYLSRKYEPQDEEQGSISQNVAKDFTVIDSGGKEVNLHDYLGKPIVINFWATWCGPCESEMPVFNKLAAEYGEEVTFLMVNLTDGSRDTVNSVKEFIADKGYTFPVYYDTKYDAANKYSIYSIPVTVFIGQDGVVTDTRRGTVNEATLRRYITKITENKS